MTGWFLLSLDEEGDDDEVALWFVGFSLLLAVAEEAESPSVVSALVCDVVDSSSCALLVIWPLEDQPWFTICWKLQLGSNPLLFQA